MSPHTIEREPEGAPAPHRLSVTRDRALLVAAEDRLMLLGLLHATGLSHDVLTPAKGGGGAFLSVALRLPWGAKEITVARGDAPGALDRVATLAVEASGLLLRRSEQPDF